MREEWHCQLVDYGTHTVLVERLGNKCYTDPIMTFQAKDLGEIIKQIKQDAQAKIKDIANHPMISKEELLKTTEPL